MSIERRFTTPVTIIEPSGVETRYLDVAPNFDDPESRVETFGLLVQSSSVEQIGGRDVTITGWILQLPIYTVISSLARVEAAEQRYEVDGEPTRRDVGMNPHVEVKLRFVAEVVA